MKEVKELIAQKICCLYPDECNNCKKGKGCPDSWSDVKEKVESILNLCYPNSGKVLAIVEPDQTPPKFDFSEEPPNTRSGFQHAIEILTTPKDGVVWKKVKV